MIETMAVCVGVLIFSCILLAVRVNHLERRMQDNEQHLQAAEYLADRSSTRIGNLSIEVSSLKRNLEQKDTMFRDLLHDLNRKIHSVEGKVSEAYETVEAQAKQEKLLFDGINSIMDYDIGVARKAVSGDAGD